MSMTSPNQGAAPPLALGICSFAFGTIQEAGFGGR